MKNLLPAICCLLSVSTGYAQIKGNPQMKGNLQSLSLSKSSSNLSPALKSLEESREPAKQNRTQPKPALPASALQNLMMVKDGKVLVNFTSTDIAKAKADLLKAGVTVTGIYGRVISGYIPVSALPLIESSAGIRYAKPSYKPMHQPVKRPAAFQNYFRGKGEGGPSVTGIVSQGDTAQLSYKARKDFRVNGDGVKVGIISDSYNNLGTAPKGVRQGELPGRDNPFGFNTPVQVVKDLDSGGTDEGRQMMEIVHDVAPGSALAFYTAYDGEADFAQGIQTLADKGCKIIGDDIFYYDEPFFQDGIIAQSVDVAKSRGVTYFSAAGNQSIRSYESKYRPTNFEPLGPGYGTAHNFSAAGDPPVYAQPLYVPGGGTIIMSFQWDQSSFSASGVGATTDFDIYLSDINGNIVAAGNSDNIRSGEPVELLGYQNDTNSPTFFLYIVKYSGPDVKHLKYILYDDALFYLTNPPIPGILAPTLVGHTKAEGAISTGAAWYLQTPPYGMDTAAVDPYSSDGGVPNYFDINGNRIAPLIRRKPNIVAPDGGNVSFSFYPNQDIPQDADMFPNFFGTSAATPHAAGVAALMLQAQRLQTITPDQVKGVLETTASDMDDSYTDGFDKGFDYNTGYGFIDAVKAVRKVKFPNNYVKDLKLKPLCSDDPSHIRSWQILNPNPFPVDVKWFAQGADQHGDITVPPGGTSFITNTVTFYNRPVANIVIISWKDNFEFPHVDAQFSTTAKCGVDKISERNSDQLISTPGIQKTISGDQVVINTAEVYPNPSSKIFRLYYSFAEKQPAFIELYSVDGRKLQSEVTEQSNGVLDIDATGYGPGLYFLHIRQGSFVKTIKLVKE